MSVQLYRLGRIREINPDLEICVVGIAWQAAWTRGGLQTIVTRHSLDDLLDHLDRALSCNSRYPVAGA